jgi:outer membrane protein TolC
MNYKILSLAILLLLGKNATAQGPLELDSCQKWAAMNYPLVQQLQLIQKTEGYSLSNANKGFLPRIKIAGQASYQSEVTEFPIAIPGMTIDPLNKDQYRLYGELNQPLTDLFIIKDHKQLIKTNTAIESKKIQIAMQKLKERINNLFFGILLLDGQISQMELLLKDLKTGISTNSIAIGNGAAMSNSALYLQAEELRAQQNLISLSAKKEAFSQMLALFIGEDKINEQTELMKPRPHRPSSQIVRPELDLFKLQGKALQAQDRLITAKNLPKFNLFFQGGAGRPALNMLSNEFNLYYIGGARLSWNIGGFYTYKKERKINALNQDGIALQKDLFLFNTKIQLKEQEQEILKSQALMQSDQEIVKLQEDIAQSTQLQLAEGSATSTDYILALNARDKAQQNLLLHEVQLLMAQYQHLTNSGNY